MKPTALAAILVSSLVVAVAPAARAATTVSAPLVASGLPQITSIVNAGDGSGRLFLTLRDGRIMIWDGTQVLATPFLDVQALVTTGDDEQGLLGLAFHPSYASNGYFYVDYTDVSGNTMVARYKVSAGDANVADSASALTILTVAQPFVNHNGGQLQFGPDGYLYIAMGDGGSAGDPNGNGQSLTTLLGKLLRIDVDSGSPYAIPPTNPFAGSPPKRPEIWAYGLRNPWRFSFDRSNGDLFIGDVGQDSREEVDYQTAGSPGGRNYGWNTMEGTACYNPPSGCNTAGLTLPILEYTHVLNRCAITGGYRYRGASAAAVGVYVYGDFCSQTIWGATQGAGGGWSSTTILQAPGLISTFGEDESGELYFTDFSNGDLYRLVFGPPSLSVGDASVPEGDSGTTPAVLTVTLSQVNANPVTVDYATASGTARAGVDFASASGTLTFAPGDTTQTLGVLVNGDTLYEADERFFVKLANPTTGISLGNDRGTVTIVDDDPAPTVSISNVTKPEGNCCRTSWPFTLTLSQAAGVEIRYLYKVVPGTARPRQDYLWSAGAGSQGYATLTFPPGTTRQRVAVQVIGDRIAEPDETFFVSVHSITPQGGPGPQVALGQGTIVNDDGP